MVEMICEEIRVFLELLEIDQFHAVSRGKRRELFTILAAGLRGDAGDFEIRPVQR